MFAKPSLSGLRELLLRRGGERYDDEPVSHLEHALQAAALARTAGAGDALVCAALLHDIGRLTSELEGTPTRLGLHDHHEALGAALLQPLLPAAVVEPVRLHAQARRYLAGGQAHGRALSEEARRSLRLQGGPMSAGERRAFESTPFHAEAVALRRWDEAANWPGRPTEDLDALWPVVQSPAR